MPLGPQNKSTREDVKRGLGHGVTAAVVESASSENRLSPEFFDLIYEWDPKAVNDEYYVTSSDFIELHSQIRTRLIRGVLLWALALCLGMASLAIVFS